MFLDKCTLCGKMASGRSNWDGDKILYQCNCGKVWTKYPPMPSREEMKQRFLEALK